ncbi:TonB-dependent receptor [Cellvibrio polysaccharolyticus]|nr:TonB-dependent receptor [Cellvibrio polysaccharolyticus]
MPARQSTTPDRKMHPLTVATRLLMAGSLLTLATAVPATWAQTADSTSASQTLRSYNIPAGPLSDALTRFSMEAGISLVGATDLARGKNSPGVQGSHSTQAALDTLLTGTGLAAERNAQGQYRLQAVNTQSATLPTVSISDSALLAAQPEAYAGGQTARGGRLGLLGNRDTMDTPFQVTHYTSKLIEDQQAQNLGDVLVNDPSIRNTYSRGAGRDEFNVRGFSLYNYDASFNGLFGVSPHSSSALIGVERVEVLKGPNALLNGIAPFGSVGGAINLVPKRAGVTPLNRVTLSYISDSQLGLHTDVARRFGEQQQTGARVNVLYSDGDMPVNGSKEALAAFTLGADYQGERFRVDGDLSYQDRTTHARSGLLLPPDSGIAIGKVPDAKHNIFPAWTYWDTKELAGSVRAEFDLNNNWTLYGALGAKDYEFASYQASWLLLDGEGTMGARPTRLDETLDTFTGEVGLRGQFETGPVHHEPVLSASVFEMDQGQVRVRDPIVMSNLYQPANIPKPDISISSDIPKIREVNLRSLALADTLSFADGFIQVTAGVRYQQVEAININAVSGENESSYDKSATTPTAAIIIKPSANLALYGNYIEGLSQGPVAPEGASNAGEIFEPSASEQYEIGGKYDWGKLTTSISFFQIDRPSSFLNPATQHFSVDGNQRNRGIELTANGEPVDGIRLLGGAAWTDAELTKSDNRSNEGNTAPAVPDFQLNLSGEWDVPALPGLTLTARVLHTASQYVDAANTQKIPEWQRFDLGARYAFITNGTPVTIRGAIENVLNENYWQSAARAGLTVGTPITFLVSVSADF